LIERHSKHLGALISQHALDVAGIAAAGLRIGEQREEQIR
jgi:hypothetical protein